VGLAGLAARRPHTLSGGQQQRVALARALATGSDLLLFDEPLSSLDAPTRDHLRTLIGDLARREGRSVLFVSHDRVDAWRLADRILVLEDGRISQQGTPQALHRAPATARVARYLGAEGHLACAGLAEGADGMAMAHPERVGLADSDGLPARQISSMFEAGRWRTRWQVGEHGEELLALHDAPPPGQAGLAIDPGALFAFAAV